MPAQTTIFVGNFEEGTKHEDLESEFKKMGPIRSISFFNTYAFIDYECEDDAQHAIDDYNGKEIFGNALRVEISHRPYDPDGPPTFQRRREFTGIHRGGHVGSLIRRPTAAMQIKRKYGIGMRRPFRPGFGRSDYGGRELKFDRRSPIADFDSPLSKRRRSRSRSPRPILIEKSERPFVNKMRPFRTEGFRHHSRSPDAPPMYNSYRGRVREIISRPRDGERFRERVYIRPERIMPRMDREREMIRPRFNDSRGSFDDLRGVSKLGSSFLEPQRSSSPPMDRRRSRSPMRRRSPAYGRDFLVGPSSGAFGGGERFERRSGGPPAYYEERRRGVASEYGMHARPMRFNPDRDRDQRSTMFTSGARYREVSPSEPRYRGESSFVRHSPAGGRPFQRSFHTTHDRPYDGPPMRRGRGRGGVFFSSRGAPSPYFIGRGGRAAYHNSYRRDSPSPSRHAPASPTSFRRSSPVMRRTASPPLMRHESPIDRRREMSPPMRRGSRLMAGR